MDLKSAQLILRLIKLSPSFGRSGSMKNIYYKVGMSVNFNKEINLIWEVENLVLASQDYNKKSNSKKYIYLIGIDENSIYFIVNFEYKECLKEFKLKSIIGFLKRICTIFNITYSGNKEYFSIKESTVLNKTDYYNILCKGTVNIGEIYKKVSSMKRKEKYERNAKESDNNYENLASKKNAMEGEEKMKIPKRTFPTLINGSRINLNDKKDDIEFPNLNSTIKVLNDLIGIEMIKENINGLSSFIIRNNERCVNLNISDPGLYYNIAISGNKGTGKDTLAKILYHIYYHLGVIGKGDFITIESADILIGNNLDRYIGNTQSGVILINNIHLLPINEKRGLKDIFDTLDDWFLNFKSNFVFILAGEVDGTKELLKNQKISKHINIFLDIPDFNETETLELVKYFAKKEEFKIHRNAYESILEYITLLKDKNCFDNIYTARRIVERGIMKNGALNNSNYLSKNDFVFEEICNKEKNINQLCILEDPYNKLQKLIGLRSVKEKVEEISAYAKSQILRKKLGLKTEPLCLHMAYYGNPGTGKTTVARYIGEIFKNMGILSSGKFVEVTREELVGKYVGHTAIKTAEKIKEAEGGILFIDEAYSLQVDSKVDFGQEAVSTIVKKMEELRENLIIIFAGYPDEMYSFIKMNPGLRDRIQFKLEFEDYKPKELLQIWKKFFDESGYKITTDALFEMDIIVNKLFNNRDSNFSNGRIMRKCFERVKMHQSIRIVSNNLNKIDDLVKINLQDIQSLYSDKDIVELLEVENFKKCIGFRGGN